MEKRYEDTILALAQELGVAKPRRYNLCHQKDLLEKIESPTLHWEVTEAGRMLLHVYRLPRLVESLEDASDGPDLGKEPLHPTKICMNCGKDKTYENFGSSDKTLDYLTKWCSSCW